MKEMTCRSICQFCYSGCGIIVHRGAGGEVSVKGDPDHPANRGQLCPKAFAIPELLRGKNRITSPMKRKKGGLERISWEEAFKIAADRLGDIRSKYGPLSLARCAGAPVSYHCRDGFRQFMGEFGSPNFTSPASLCMAPRFTAFHAVLGEARAEADFERSNLVIFWASNPLASERYSAFGSFNGMRRILPRLKEKGARIIAIDAFQSLMAKKADQWVKIKQGSDAALGLAMIHVIVKEGLYDKSFVENYAHGFARLVKHVEPLGPAWASGITGLSVEAIQDLAREYARVKPAAICDGNGLDMYTNGVDAVRTLGILMGLTGNLDVPGGNVFLPFVGQPMLPTKPAPKEKRVWYETFPLFPEVPMIGIKESILREEDDRPRAMIIHHSNPVLIHGNEKRTREAIRKLDFVMVSEIFPTATSELADLILPMAAVTESSSYLAYASAEGGYLALSRPLAEPPGEARPVFDVEYELAERMGLQQNYPFRDTLSWLRFMIEPSGITLERLQGEQIVYGTPPVEYRKHESRGFKTASGKVDFYCRRFEAKAYPPLPAYAEPAGEPLGPHNTTEKGFSLIGSTRRPGQFIHTRFKRIEILNRKYPEPLIRIYAEDAAARGIKEGDMVEVTSAQGKVGIKAEISEEVSPGQVLVDFGWGNPSDGKASINSLTSDACFNPVSGATPNRLFPCEVKKSGR